MKLIRIAKKVRYFSELKPGVNSQKNVVTEKRKNFFARVLQTPTGTENTRRSLIIIPTMAVHLSIGSIYSWSMYNSALTKSLGVVAPSAADWAFSSVVPIFSTVTFFHGVSAWLLSNWQVRVGPRFSLALGAAFFGGGMILSGIGAKLHFLPLLYLGYGVLGGIGLGLSYVPPMANLIRWFPEKVGFAAGITSCGFGGAAFLATPIIQRLLTRFYETPKHIGNSENLKIETLSDGRRIAQVDEKTAEVVGISNSLLPGEESVSLMDFYEVGTGSSGAASTLMTMGAVYFATMTAAAFLLKKPPKYFNPKVKIQINPSQNTSRPSFSKTINRRLGKVSGLMAGGIRRILPKPVLLGEPGGNVAISTVMRCRQFYFLWLMFAALATVGMSIAGTAKDMILDVFGNAMPNQVTSSSAVYFVAFFSLFNLGGRLFWASFSDHFGRKNTFRIFTYAGFPLALILPLSVVALLRFKDEEFSEKYGERVSKVLSNLSLGMFLSSALLIASIFGGTYATVPALATEMFGRFAIDRVQGRMLTASALAGISGPLIVTRLRGKSEKAAFDNLLAVADEEKLKKTYGVDKKAARVMVNAGSLTISQLMEVVPEGTKDPSPKLYNSTLITLSALFLVAAIANKGISPLHKSVYKVKK